MLKILRVCSIIVACCLTACGFHLRGTQSILPLQLQRVYIDTSKVPHSAIAPELTVALKNVSVVCVDNPYQALITLNILEDKRNNRQVGSGASQETRKYELTELVTFELIDHTGKHFYGPVSVSSTLSHYVYSGQVFGNNQEEGTLYQSLRRNVVQQILFKLGSQELQDALLNNPAIAATVNPSDQNTEKPS